MIPLGNLVLTKHVPRNMDMYVTELELLQHFVFLFVKMKMFDVMKTWLLVLYSQPDSGSKIVGLVWYIKQNICAFFDSLYSTQHSLVLSSVCTGMGDPVVRNMDEKLKVICGKEKQF